MIFALKFGHSEKTTKVWNNLPLHLMFTKQKTNQVGDCFQFCGLPRKPELLKKILGRLPLVQRDWLNIFCSYALDIDTMYYITSRPRTSDFFFFLLTVCFVYSTLGNWLLLRNFMFVPITTTYTTLIDYNFWFSMHQGDL